MLYYDFVCQQYDTILAERNIQVSREQLTESIEVLLTTLILSSCEIGQLLNPLIFVGFILILMT